jgi:glutathione-regulated potassium-efflux system protein KefB
MAAESGAELAKAVVLLGAGVLAVPLFKRLGLGAVLGYLVAGVAIGPWGAGFFSDAQTVLHIAELGVVMFLFIIGLETQPTRLWKLRGEIFGLGLMQVVACGTVLTAVAHLGFGLALPVAFVAAMGFVLTSTAIVMQVLGDAGETTTARGQRIVSTLLMEDLAIVPLLATVALLAPAQQATDARGRWLALGAALVAVVALVAVSRFVLNPVFRLLAASRAREVMTGAALLVVLGAALAMQWVGLSMALGAFVAGVMLSESSFRHQLEADIEPFRGLLLGLFFMGVGMSLDLSLVRSDGVLIVAGALLAMALKSGGVYLVARLRGIAGREALWRAILMGQGGEFAFVLYAAAAAAGLIVGALPALLTAGVIVSMALAPLTVLAMRRWAARQPRPLDLQGVETADAIAGADAARTPRALRRDQTDTGDGSCRTLVIGFGRFGQVVCQALLARGTDVAIIDRDTDMIRAAANFGFKVYYGDGTRLDVLRACGAETARAVLVCTDDKADTSRIVELLRETWPLVPVMARAFDRQHAIALMQRGIAAPVRETFESALVFGGEALALLGVPDDEQRAVLQDVRTRDAERLQLQLAGGVQQGRDRMHTQRWTPTPFTRPQQPGSAINDEAKAQLDPQPAG